MLQLENTTPFKATIAVLPDRAGIDTLYVVVKATLEIRPKLSLAEEQVPVDPRRRVLRRSGDLEPARTVRDAHRQAGHRRAAGRQRLGAGGAAGPADAGLGRGRGTSEDDARHRRSHLARRTAVGSAAVRIDAARLGARVRRVPSARRDRAGRGAQSRRLRICRRTTGRRPEGSTPPPNLEGQPLPNSRIRRRRFSRPARSRRPPAWRRSRRRGCRVARLPAPTTSAGSAAARPICRTISTRASFSAPRRSSPSIAICRRRARCRSTGASPDGPIAFTVPDPRLVVAVTVAGATEEPPAHLETLSIEPDENRACFTWRAAVPCDRRALKVEKIVVSRAGSRTSHDRHHRRHARAVRDRQRHRAGVGVGARRHRAHRQLARDGPALRADSDGARAGGRAGHARRRRSTSCPSRRARGGCCGWRRRRSRPWPPNLGGPVPVFSVSRT